MQIRVEFHVHTVLSPCGAVEMIPPIIVQAALERGIGCIAITDHNTCRNVEAVIQAARGKNLHVLPGMELQTREEVHLLCIFDTLEQSRAWQKIVDQNLPDLKNDPEKFGAQFVVDATGDFLEYEERLLAVSSQLTLAEAIDQIHRLGGLAIPAHIDRLTNGLLAVLGFVPPDLKADALEVTARCNIEATQQKNPSIRGYPLVRGGDAHYYDDLFGNNSFEVIRPCIAEFRLAFAGKDGRNINILPKEPKI